MQHFVTQLNLFIAGHNRMLLMALTAAVTGQMLKVLFTLIRERRFRPGRLFETGGFPSSHSALVTSLTTAVGDTYGFHSHMFAIVTVFALIVLHDAIGLRRAAGHQARMINLLRRTMPDADLPQEDLKERLGHTPWEVLGGALWGIFMTAVFY